MGSGDRDGDLDIQGKLKVIVAYYEAVTQVKAHEYHTGIFGLVAESLNEIGGRGWGWRYIYNVYRGVQESSRFLTPAINELYSDLSGLPLYAPTPVCPACGIVHVKGCPEARPKDTRRRYRINVDPDTFQRIRAAAEARGVTVAELVRGAVERELRAFDLRIPLDNLIAFWPLNEVSQEEEDTHD
jgi:hypothetical protein